MRSCTAFKSEKVSEVHTAQLMWVIHWVFIGGDWGSLVSRTTRIRALNRLHVLQAARPPYGRTRGGTVV